MSKLKSDSKNGRDRQLGVRLDDEEYEMIQQAAQASGESVQLWGRKALIRATGNEPKPPAYAKQGRPQKETQSPPNIYDEETDKMQTLAERLKSLREGRGWKLREVAEKAEVSISHVSLIESGKVDPSLKVLRNVSNVYGLTVRDILVQVKGYDGPLQAHDKKIAGEVESIK